ncbi:hypothetical protein ECB98_21055 [Brucellaceae bacterium VT-16-1752]|uniref:Uncharacterized protein n=1 Tax=Ochrobactrum soli TaxID=2448455 RepID=A0A849KMI3_9HYPH|nr:MULTISPECIES: hypothetical protein [Brucella]NNU60867.1 hypothetical protein [[Ochrobactrum] soli]RRD22161.1 hypothetical protein ECB98_21055 [Brucellaceae bacterium VT-16-1752]WHS30411.1 hypothetical protein QLQ09_02215 [Brucella sp. NM4]WHT45247.1 hypothetical protein QLQ11_19840 [Ochrobactrum sp. SSR]
MGALSGANSKFGGETGYHYAASIEAEFWEEDWTFGCKQQMGAAMSCLITILQKELNRLKIVQ